MKHTPTPWKLYPKDLICDAYDNNICEVDGSSLTFEEQKANAKHIVKCVNSFDSIPTTIGSKIADLQAELNQEMKNSAKPGNPYTAGLQGRINGLKEALNLFTTKETL